MCLSEIDLNLKYDESEKDFIGYGYKTMPINRIRDELGNINWATARRFMYSKDWVEATGDYLNPCSRPDTLIQSNMGQNYFPGFHIFLRKEDAREYGLSAYMNPIVFKVAFKNVTSFGKNEINGFDTGPCVVARYMKIVEILEG